MRRRAFDQLCAANPGAAPAELLAATQRLLDRVLFCAFSQARGLLPAETIARAHRHTDSYNPRPIWENFKGLFRSIDLGNALLQIPKYNGCLFEADLLLDRLVAPDAVCEVFATLAGAAPTPCRSPPASQAIRRTSVIVPVPCGYIPSRERSRARRSPQSSARQIRQESGEKTPQAGRARRVGSRGLR